MHPPQSPTARLLAAGCAFPEHVVPADVLVDVLARRFPGEERGFLSELIDRSGVRERRIALPLAETLAPRSFSERNAAWREIALGLAARAAGEAIGRSGVLATEVDDVIDVSCTGITIPALDVDLVRLLGLRPDVRRIPITESGCAGGALALSLGADLARTGRRVLVVAVELCSQALVPGDESRASLVSSLLFGDGAAAAVLAPESSSANRAGFRHVASATRLVPDSSSAMGFDVGEHGLRIVLARELPLVLAESLRPSIQSFLAERGFDIADVGLHLVHPGSRKILDAYADAFSLPAGTLALSHASLAEHGNLSSASILAVLDAALRQGLRPPAGTLILVVGVGPGLSIELSLWS
jgi:alkylresorcinol/alkylpyrone synthase